MTGRVNIRHRVLDDGSVVPVIDCAMVDRAEHAVGRERAALLAGLSTPTCRLLAKAALKGALGPDLIIDHEGAAR